MLRLSLLLPLAIGLLGASAFPDSYETCVTVSGKKPVKHVPTSTYTNEITYTVKSTSCIYPTTTVKPAPSIVTVTRTTTRTSNTAITQTDTATSDITSTTTVTSFAPTSTATTTQTDTTLSTSTTTATVATVDGFLPIKSSLPNSSSKKKRQNRQVPGASLFARSQKKGLQCPPQKYPKFVNCNVVSYVPTTVVYTTTEPVKTVTACPKTSTTTTRVTTTITSTSFPKATTTTTVLHTDTSTSTVTPTTTSTTTSTSTSTVFEAAATPFIAQCGSDNLASYGRNGFDMDGGSFENNYGVVDTVTATPYDCCVACFNDPTCEGGVYVGGGCEYGITQGTDTCSSPGQYDGTVYESSARTGMYSWFNGNCAFWDIYY